MFKKKTPVLIFNYDILNICQLYNYYYKYFTVYYHHYVNVYILFLMLRNVFIV